MSPTAKQQSERSTPTRPAPSPKNVKGEGIWREFDDRSGLELLTADAARMTEHLWFLTDTPQSYALGGRNQGPRHGQGRVALVQRQEHARRVADLGARHQGARSICQQLPRECHSCSARPRSPR